MQTAGGVAQESLMDEAEVGRVFESVSCVNALNWLSCVESEGNQFSGVFQG